RVHGGAHGDVRQRQRVPRADLRRGARHQPVADAHALGRQDVALLPVGVVQQGDPGAPVGIVLDVGDLRRNPVLVPLEIDRPVLALVAASLVAGRDATVRVAARLLRELAGEGLLRLVAGDLREVGDARPASARRGRLVLANRHGYGPFASKISIESPAASLTTARFWSGRLPEPSRVRLTFPLRFMVFTFRTRTFQICWIASLISVLLDSGATKNV